MRVLIFDTETRTDVHQDLMFGVYRICKLVDGLVLCESEGVGYSEEITKAELAQIGTSRIEPANHTSVAPVRTKDAGWLGSARQTTEGKAPRPMLPIAEPVASKLTDSAVAVYSSVSRVSRLVLRLQERLLPATFLWQQRTISSGFPFRKRLSVSE